MFCVNAIFRNNIKIKSHEKVEKAFVAEQRTTRKN